MPSILPGSLAIIGAVFAIAAFFAGARGPAYRERFSRDNADGAAANAAESIEKIADSAPIGSVILIAALLFFLLAVAVQIRNSLWRLEERLPRQAD